MHIGTAIRAAREQKQMTQKSVAEKLGCARTHVSKLERGIVSPRTDTLVLIGEAIGIEGWRIMRYASRQAAK